MPRLTEGHADRMKVPAGARDVQEFDDELPGFGIRKFAKGHASYFVKFNVGAQQRRKTLGKVVRGNLKAMRLEASAILAKARLGTDVVAEQRASAARNVTTLGELVPRYLAARQSELRQRTFLEAKRYMERAWLPLHPLAIDAVKRSDIVTVIDDLEAGSGKVAADRARTALSAFFAWCIDRGHVESNPTNDIRARAQNGSRTRVLTEGELVEVWKASGDDDYGRIVKLLMLTGQRRTEIGDLVWPEINLAERQIDLPPERTKNARAHIVPLSDAVVDILEAVPRREGRELLFGNGSGGFSGWSKAKAMLDERLAEARGKTAKPMPAWTLHDLRRSFVTHVNERKFALPHVVEAICNHVSGHLAGVAGTYNKALYLGERRQALQLWGEHVAALVAGRQPKVVPLRRRG